MNRLTCLGLPLVILFLLAAPDVTSAAGLDTSIILQGFGGTALNLPSRLTVHHAEQGSFRHRATWETRPFEQPFYWALRARWQRRDDGFELQLIHHKLYLKNNPPLVDHFEVTHGFNVLTVNYLRRSLPIQPRFGLGIVIPHAESVVDGAHHGSAGYSIGGPAIMVGGGWEHGLGRHFMVAADIQFVAGWATVDIDAGEARVRNLALHLLLGIGVGF